ncbi:saccharopine dehydrogenase family protein [Leptolyngbya sp. PCC 6406]|uniref:saccharopine dehydrogenase family protein n=1 Tax=Leptolyngbya sp. PCC 6406 TaxID=1173264 RepID=UPI0002ACE1A7|nr:saccharopine dehydrogenase NADP-binding domain-containing protein [Leptolyngbya sp. PCC 6406]
MTQKVLILGGRGRIGASVAADLAQYTTAAITVTGRRCSPGESLGSGSCLVLDLADRLAVAAAIADHNLVIHCAGPFSYRDRHVLETCIAQGVNYLDVADNPRYVRAALDLKEQATAAGVTALVSTGVFPGISNSMVRQGIEALDHTDTIHLSYGVAGSGGAGVTVLRTTFLELQHPFSAWIDGSWRTVQPYSQRQKVNFPTPIGSCGVYWFNTVEAMTLAESFPVQTVVTKFGSVPDIYNHLTWLTAHALPKDWLRRPETVEFLAQISYRMTQISDRWSGVGIAMVVTLTGHNQNRPIQYQASFAHTDTAQAAGWGTGSIAQALLAGTLQAPGVWPVEQVWPTAQFQRTLAQRGGIVISDVAAPSSCPH